MKAAVSNGLVMFLFVVLLCSLLFGSRCSIARVALANILSIFAAELVTCILEGRSCSALCAINGDLSISDLILGVGYFFRTTTEDRCVNLFSVVQIL
jgi:hypothetical protein